VLSLLVIVAVLALVTVTSLRSVKRSERELVESQVP
jgi:hypothetical protein